MNTGTPAKRPKYSYCIDQTGVALSDPGSMQSYYHYYHYHIIELSPRNWETTMRHNIVLTVFPTQNVNHHVWKSVITTLQSIVSLQLRGEGHEMDKNCGTNQSYSFPCFSNLIPGIGEQQNIKIWFSEFSTHGFVWKIVRATF